MLHNTLMVQLQQWLFTVGYSLAFGTVLAKMWRVYQIFQNPLPNKKILSNRHFITIILVITMTVVALLLLGHATPYLRGSVILERDQEDMQGENHLGVREEYILCVGLLQRIVSTFVWQIFIYVCLAMLQIVGILLAFQTRKIKMKGLNDSKFVATIIYISSIVMVVLALVTVALRTYINTGTGIFVGGIFILTTTFLALNFIPKMILLYKDPKGTSVNSISVTMETTQTGTQINYELENKITILENTVLELKNEIETLKVEEHNSHEKEKQI